nr:SH3 domain-containing protein [uncultured Desulfobulbus sp.]
MHQRNLFSTVRACLLIAPMVIGLAGSLEAKSIGKDQVNIRSGPALNSKIIFTAPLGYPIKVEKEENNWSYFRDWQNNTGWVYKPLVSNIDTAVILVEKANVRSKATTNSKVVAVAEMGEIYTLLGKTGNWVKLGYYHGGAALGWIRDDLVFGE